MSYRNNVGVRGAKPHTVGKSEYKLNWIHAVQACVVQGTTVYILL